MSPQSPLDSVRQILAELDISLLRANSHAEQSALIENALKRLRLLFTQSRMLFTESVVQQIKAYKALLKPPPTAGIAPVALPDIASTTAGSKPVREPASIVPNSFTVGFVLQVVDAAIRRAFPTEVWIRGEVSGYTIAKSGIHYFDLVERTAEGEQRVIPCVIWKSSWIAVRKKLLTADVALAPGQEMLFFGRVSIFDRTGKVNFIISDVFPEFTLGQIEMRRRAVLARLQAEGLTERNKRLPFPELPLRIALVSSRTAAGLTDFTKALTNSGYDFTVIHVEVPVQGANVESAVCRALEVLALKHAELKMDVVCIVRGGGSAVELSCWDSFAICAMIARLPVPVITGIGHQRDRVAADEVAHTAADTPTAAAELLCRAVRTCETALATVTRFIEQLACTRLAAEKDALAANVQSFTERIFLATSTQHRQAASLRDQLLAHARRVLELHATRLDVCRDHLATESPRTLQFLAQETISLTLQVVEKSAEAFRIATLRRDTLANQILSQASRILEPHVSRLQVCTIQVPVEARRLLASSAQGTLLLTRQVALIASTSLRESSRLLSRLAGDLGPLSAKHARAADEALSELMGFLLAAIEQAQRVQDGRLKYLRELVIAHDPEAVLRRGFSITLDATGRTLRDAAAALPGSTLVTRLAHGKVHSTVTKAD